MERRIVPEMRKAGPARGFRRDIMAELPVMTPDTHHAPAVPQPNGSNGSEGRSHRNAGIPAIVRGPGDMTKARRPSDDVAHGEPNSRDTFIRHMAERLLVKA